MLRAASLAAVFACAALLAGCGEDEPPPAPELPADRLLDRAFERLPGSGRAAIDLEAQLPQDPSERVAAGFEGPFVAGGGVPRFDLEGEAEAAGFGAELRLVSTGDDAFVVFFGENYRVGRDRVAALGQRASGLEPRGWFGPAEHAGVGEVEGADCHRIEAPLERGRLAADLDRIGLGAGVGGLEGGTVEACLGVDDGMIRALELSSEGLILDLSLSDLGEEQEIEPPPGGGFQPVDELLERIPGP